MAQCFVREEGKKDLQFMAFSSFTPESKTILLKNKSFRFNKKHPEDSFHVPA